MSKNYVVEKKLHALVESCISQLCKYNAFSGQIEPCISVKQILNTVHDSLEIVDGELVSKLALEKLKVMIMNVYSVEMSA